MYRIKLVHGDIKLDNILYTREGRGDFSLMLGDMGSSHNLHRGDIFYQPTRDTRRTKWDPHCPHINNKNNTIHANAICDLFSVMFVLNSIVFSHVDKGCYLHTLYREKKVDIDAAVRNLDGNTHWKWAQGLVLKLGTNLELCHKIVGMWRQNRIHSCAVLLQQQYSL